MKKKNKKKSSSLGYNYIQGMYHTYVLTNSTRVLFQESSLTISLSIFQALRLSSKCLIPFKEQQQQNTLLKLISLTLVKGVWHSLGPTHLGQDWVQWEGPVDGRLEEKEVSLTVVKKTNDVDRGSVVARNSIANSYGTMRKQ